jgi:hypothetical protein
MSIPAVEGYGHEAASAATAVTPLGDLPRGSFVAYNRESGAELAGKLF